MKLKFIEVDCGCFMYETENARWIIEHPTKGYKATISKMWDAIIEHPENPHSVPLKLLGSYTTKSDAIKSIQETIQKGGNYHTLNGIENTFYNRDYTAK
jgi:CTP synthase (UTP-ammonia lyase)